MIHFAQYIYTEFIFRVFTQAQRTFAFFYRIVRQLQFYKTKLIAAQLPAIPAVSIKLCDPFVGLDLLTLFIPRILSQNLNISNPCLQLIPVRMLCIFHVAAHVRINPEALYRQDIPLIRLITCREMIIINTAAYLDACTCVAERITVCLHLCTDMNPGISCFLIINGGKRRAVQCDLRTVFVYGVITAIRIERLADVTKRLIPVADSPCDLCIFQSV